MKVPPQFARAQVRHHANANAARAAEHFPPQLQKHFSAEDARAALAEISAWEKYCATELVQLGELGGACNVGAIFYKDESSRFGLRSFKALGGAYAVQWMLRRELGARIFESETFREQTSRIVAVTATDGNHGRAVAWGAQRFGCACKIFIHAGVSESRAHAMRELGAEIVRVDGNYDDSVQAARAAAESPRHFFISDTSTESYTEIPRVVMAGYGVMLFEMLRQLRGEKLTHVFVQGGVGGLAAAVAAFFWRELQADRPRIIVVEPTLAACLFESARRGKASAVHIKRETIMAGLSCGEVSYLAWNALALAANDFLAIEDELIAPVMRMLARGGIECGETGAAGLAACLAACAQPRLKSALGLNAQSCVLTIGTEGATDREIYDAIVARGEISGAA